MSELQDRVARMLFDSMSRDELWKAYSEVCDELEDLRSHRAAQMGTDDVALIAAVSGVPAEKVRIIVGLAERRLRELAASRVSDQETPRSEH